MPTLPDDQAYVTYCSWCPDPRNPDPESHPGGAVQHRSRATQLDIIIARLNRIVVALERLTTHTCPAPAMPWAASLFGYRQGQEPLPTRSEYEMARMFLGGKLHDPNRPHSIEETRLGQIVAQEIVDRWESQ